MSIRIENFELSKPTISHTPEHLGQGVAHSVGETALIGSLEWTLDRQHPTKVDSGFAVENLENAQHSSEPKHLANNTENIVSLITKRARKVAKQQRKANLRDPSSSAGLGRF